MINNTLVRKFIPFWLFLLFFKFAGGLHYVLIPVLGEKILPIWLIGIVIGASSLIQLACDIPAGFILDKFGYKKMLLFGTVIFTLSVSILLFPLTKITFITSVLLASFGWLFFGPGINAYTLHESPNKSVGKYFSLQEIFGSIGIVLSTIMLPVMVLYSSKNMSLVLIGIFICAIIAIILTQREKKIDPKENTSVNIKHIKALIKKLRPVSIILIFSGLSASIFYSFIWFVVPLIIAQGQGSSLLGFGLSVFDLSIVLLGFILGKTVDKGNQKILIAIGLLLFALSGVLISFNLNGLFLLLGFTATTGDELSELALWKWLHTVDTDRSQDGLVSSIVTFFSDLGWGIGPILAGILYPHIGAKWTIFIGSIFLCITLSIYMFFFYKNKYITHNVQFFKKPYKKRHKIH